MTQLIEFWSNASLSGKSFAITLYAIAGFIVWYCFYAFETFLNGGSRAHKGTWWVLRYFWEETLWFSPGGLEKRKKHLQMICRTTTIVGCQVTYEYNNLEHYEARAKHAFGSGLYFWGMKVCIAFFLWPLLLALLAGAFLIGILF